MSVVGRAGRVDAPRAAPREIPARASSVRRWGVRAMAGEGPGTRDARAAPWDVHGDDPAVFARRAALGAASSALRDPWAFITGAGEFTLQAAGAVLGSPPAAGAAEGDLAEDLRLRFAQFSDLASTSLSAFAENGRGVEEGEVPFLGFIGGGGGLWSSSVGHSDRARRLERVQTLESEVARMRSAIADIRSAAGTARVPVRDTSGLALSPDAYLDAMKTRLDEIAAELDLLVTL